MDSFKEIDGVYIGPEVYRGTLDLRGSCATSLGGLRKVGGHLWLEGTGVSDLGDLTEVGGWLGLEGTCVTDLGDLRKVGIFVLTGTGKYYELPRLQKLTKEVENYSVSDLVERLYVEEDPFLKRVIERRIRE